MDEGDQLLLAQAKALECLCLKHLVHHLQLRKVVAASQSAQGFVEFRGFKIRCGEYLAPIAFPWMLQVKGQIHPAVEFEITLDEVAGQAGTISNEILTGLSHRPPRIWTDHGGY